MILKNNSKVVQLIEYLYPETVDQAIEILQETVNRWPSEKFSEKKWLDQHDAMLITYGDTLLSDNMTPLETLNTFLTAHVKGALSAVHLLPMFPYSSDDGFSVIDYRKINSELGSWDDISRLAQSYDLMFDGVINHISAKSDWFKRFLDGDTAYQDYFIVADPARDYSSVTRPRALPLLTKFDKQGKTAYVWTTFSDDQIDLNFKSPNVLAEIVDILMLYSANGAKYIRLDAIGFGWKELGTSCIHLPQLHAIVKLLRILLDDVAKGTIIITETNVPHKENISYFGDGYNEAHLVYQFPLPPLTLFTFLKGDSTQILRWLDMLEPTTSQTTFFNFLASHDGIGLRPIEGLLSDEDKELLVSTTQHHGGFVNFKANADGTKSPYELNINYMDALTAPDLPSKTRIDKFVAAHTLLLSLAGIPAIYIHSLLGSRNWLEGVRQSGINRRINRQKLPFDRLQKELEHNPERREVFNQIIKRLNLRKTLKAFDPNASQRVVTLSSDVFSILRDDHLLVLISVIDHDVYLDTDYHGDELISGQQVDGSIKLTPYQAMWINLSK